MDHLHHVLAFHEACKSGNAQKVLDMLDLHGFQYLNHYCDLGDSAPHSFAFVPKSSCSSSSRFTGLPLHTAVVNGHFTIAKTLLQCGADVDAPGRNGGFSILEFCVHWSMREQVKFLLENGAMINFPRPNEADADPHRGGDGDSSSDFAGGPTTHVVTLLQRAALNGNYQVVKMLLEHGANCSVRDGRGRNIKAWTGESKTKTLTQLYTDPLQTREIIDEYYDMWSCVPPLTMQCIWKLKSMKWKIEEGFVDLIPDAMVWEYFDDWVGAARWLTPDMRDDALRLAMINNESERVTELLNWGAKITSLPQSILLSCVENGARESVKCLLRYPEIEEVEEEEEDEGEEEEEDGESKTDIHNHITSMMNFCDTRNILSALLSNTDHNMTVDRDLVELLMENGAKPEIGNRVLFKLDHTQAEQYATFFLKNHANPNYRDPTTSTGETWLMSAVYYGILPVIKLLLSFGACPLLADALGESSIDKMSKGPRKSEFFVSKIRSCMQPYINIWRDVPSLKVLTLWAVARSSASLTAEEWSAVCEWCDENGVLSVNRNGNVTSLPEPTASGSISGGASDSPAPTKEVANLTLTQNASDSDLEYVLKEFSRIHVHIHV